ncbi:protein BYPASS1-LIKE-like [Rutidosis leptorrhynchoides]|uniref:protein BYPASS1-LIKE-like n=1 Tax=Rutidosis leptorrhynchoides TaxID=125765 RepID=UPI003A990E8F
MEIDCHGSSSPYVTRIRRTILCQKRNPVVHSIGNQTLKQIAQEKELEAFQKLVTQKLHNLSLVDSNELLSVSWISKLLDAFIRIQEQFTIIISNNKSFLAKQPMEKPFSDYFERSVKALDVCNAIRDGIEQMREWKNQVETVLCVLGNQRFVGVAEIRRAKRALKDLDIKETNLAQRNRSFNQKEMQHEKSLLFRASRSLSWSVSIPWSVSKQLQAIGSNIVVPKSSEILATNGLVLAFYTMSHVLSFVMWALLAVLPCQDFGGLHTHVNTPKVFAWWVPLHSLQERIMVEYKKRDIRNSHGLLKETQVIEMYACYMNRFIDWIRFPLMEEHEKEMKQRIEELRTVYDSLKNELDPFERQVKEVFHLIVRCRVEGLGSISRRNSF